MFCKVPGFANITKSWSWKLSEPKSGFTVVVTLFNAVVEKYLSLKLNSFNLWVNGTLFGNAQYLLSSAKLASKADHKNTCGALFNNISPKALKFVSIKDILSVSDTS